jgi:hypothetical protein
LTRSLSMSMRWSGQAQHVAAMQPLASALSSVRLGRVALSPGIVAAMAATLCNVGTLSIYLFPNPQV